MHYFEFVTSNEPATKMDGNLLDSETADETLAKDWNLPELPEGVHMNLALECAGISYPK